jgi:ABC-type dipeptide/oligopeptide/nickel transport system permease component
MTGYVVKRLLIAIPTLLGAYTLIFLSTRLVPGDPVLLILEENFSRGDSEEAYAAVERQLGLHRPIWEQYFISLWDTLQGNFGTSFQNNRPVSVNITDQAADTVRLAIAAMLVSAIIGIPAGVVAAVRRNRWPDLVATVAALIALCAPGFWLGILLLLVFSLKLQLLPTFGVGEAGDPISIVRHLVLPALALGAAGAGLIARVTRSAMLEVLSQDYVRTARAKGLRERFVVMNHGFRNALIPVVTIFGLEAITLLSGTVVTERVFARRGLGNLLVDAVLTRDYPQIQAILILFVGIAILVNIVIDVIYVFVDPRIRY